MPQNSPSSVVRSRKRVTGISVPVATRRPVRTTNTVTRAEYDAIMDKGMSEDALREQIRRNAYAYGFTLHYHTYRSDRSEPGFPDDVFVNRAGTRLVFIEAKRQSERLSTDQVVWLDGLAIVAAKTSVIEVYVVRPSDRDKLWGSLLGSVDGGLHRWCLDAGCERCEIDRIRARPRRPPTRKRQGWS